MIDNDLDDEIVIGIDRPKTEKKTKKKKVAKKATSQNIKKADKSKKNVKNSKSSKNNKNNKPKKSKKKLLKMLLFLCLIGLVVFLLNSSFFNITKVEVVNNSKVTKEELKEIANFESYKNIFWINTRKIESEIKKNNAYVEEVQVSRKLPNTAIITLTERVPKYMLQFADSYVYINNQGYMLEVSTENIGLPIILGFKTDLSNIEVGKRFDVEDLKQMETIIKIVETANVNEVGQYITKIDISDEKNYTLFLESEQKTVYLGDCSDLNTRMLYLNGLLKLTKDVAGELFINMDLNTERAYFREKT